VIADLKERTATLPDGLSRGEWLAAGNERAGSGELPYSRPTDMEAEGMTQNNADLVRSYFAAYESRDQQVLEDLIAEAGFAFYSPVDDGIDRQTYFQRCFPTMRPASTTSSGLSRSTTR
jgi:hypothetical protein